MGSCVPLQIISAAFDPHCWNATSFADPEKVMDFTSPNAFCAAAITVFASCARALAHRDARQIETTASFFNTASPINLWVARWHAPVPAILYPLGLRWGPAGLLERRLGAWCVIRIAGPPSGRPGSPGARGRNRR